MFILPVVDSCMHYASSGPPGQLDDDGWWLAVRVVRVGRGVQRREPCGVVHAARPHLQSPGRNQRGPVLGAALAAGLPAAAPILQPLPLAHQAAPHRGILFQLGQQSWLQVSSL